MATDNFDRSDENPLSDGGNWASAPSGYNSLKVVSGEVQANSNSAWNAQYYTGTYEDCQYSECEVYDQNYTGPTVRAASDGKFYVAMVISANRVRTARQYAGGSLVTLVTYTSVPFVSGAVCRIEVDNYCNVSAYYNGVYLGTYDDSTADLGSGAPGIASFAPADTVVIDNWEGGTSPPKQVYYSVCPYGSGELKTGSPTILIASGEATLSVTQTGNIGVGCAIEYGYGSGECFISYVNSGISFGVVGRSGETVPEEYTPLVVDSIHHEYENLAQAIAGASDSNHINDTELTTANVVLNIPCYADHDDQTADANSNTLTITGYTTDSTRYIKIYTPNSSGECISDESGVGNYQRHPGWPNASAPVHYRFTSSKGWGQAIQVSQLYTEVIGLDVLRTGSGTGYAGVHIQTAGDYSTIDSCLVKDTAAHGIWSYGNQQSGVVVRNCLAYGCGQDGLKVGFGNNATFVNCTSVGNAGYGIGISSTGYYFRVINCLSTGNTTADFNSTIHSSTVVAYSSFGDTSLGSWGGTPVTCRSGESANFSFESGTNNYHLASDDAGAMNYGAGPTEGTYGNYVPLIDVDGNLRSGETCDIGFDEYYSGVSTDTLFAFGISPVRLIGEPGFTGIIQTANVPKSSVVSIANLLSIIFKETFDSSGYDNSNWSESLGANRTVDEDNTNGPGMSGPASGTYCLYCENVGAGGAVAYADNSIDIVDNTDPWYASMYFGFDTNTTIFEDGESFAFFRAIGNRSNFLELENDNGVFKIYFKHYSTSDYAYHYSTRYTVSSGEWHLVELFGSDATDYWEFRVNGASIDNAFNYPTLNYQGDIDQIQVGIVGQWTGTPEVELYLDEIEIRGNGWVYPTADMLRAFGVPSTKATGEPGFTGIIQATSAPKISVIGTLSLQEIATGIIALGVAPRSFVGSPGLLASIFGTSVDSKSEVGDPGLLASIFATNVDPKSSTGMPILLAYLLATSVDPKSDTGEPGILASIAGTSVESKSEVGDPGLLASILGASVAPKSEVGLAEVLAAIFGTSVAPKSEVGTPGTTGIIGTGSVPQARGIGTPQFLAVLTATGLAGERALGQPGLRITDLIRVLTGVEPKRGTGSPDLNAILSASSVERIPVVGDPQLLAILSALGVPSTASLGDPSVVSIIVEMISALGVESKSGVGQPKLILISLYPDGYIFPLVEIDIDLSEISLIVDVGD